MQTFAFYISVISKEIDQNSVVSSLPWKDNLKKNSYKIDFIKEKLL